MNLHFHAPFYERTRVPARAQSLIGGHGREFGVRINPNSNQHSNKKSRCSHTRTLE